MKSIGLLASFDVSPNWVDHPYRDGVALLGDAAAISDPSFGQGLATTLRDAHVLRDAMLANSDWDHRRQPVRKSARRILSYHRTKFAVGCEPFFRIPAAEAQSVRQRAMPRIAEDQTRVPDHLFAGPDLPADDTVHAVSSANAELVNSLSRKLLKSSYLLDIGTDKFRPLQIRRQPVRQRRRSANRFRHHVRKLRRDAP